MVANYTIEFQTRKEDEIVDLTGRVAAIIADGELVRGSALIFVPGATGGVSTIEYEPGLIEDFPSLMSRLIPADRAYRHDQTWQDGNGHSHLRASLIGPSLIVPFDEKRLMLGTWQQIVFFEFDNKPHRRRLIVQLQGE